MTNLNIQCPIPDNETQRLKAIHSYSILDTPPEVDFDTLTRVAIQALNAPAGVIGLMDSNRLWFKSQIGLGVPQLERQIAFCAHAIMRPDEPLIIEDLTKDERFQNNPLVLQAPNLRFYAGAPLIDRNGYALGTIAVVDTLTRRFDEDQRNLLCDLSSLVITALEGRHKANILSHLATTDYLTGLANRVRFEKTLNSEISHANRSGESFSILFMDLDGFKSVNDNLGHAAGDEVLCEVGYRMMEQVRAEDLLARFGGDEFGVLLRQSGDDAVDVIARRIIDVVSKPITLSTGDTVSVGISIGISKYTNMGDSVAKLLSQADDALYMAKENKRNVSPHIARPNYN